MDKVKATMAQQIAQAAIAFEQRRTGSHAPESGKQYPRCPIVRQRERTGPSSRLMAMGPFRRAYAARSNARWNWWLCTPTRSAHHSTTEAGSHPLRPT